MSKLRVQFGHHLRHLRQGSGLTQAQLAEAAQISVEFLGLIERGIRAPSFETLERLSQALQVTPDKLFDLTDNGDA